MPNRQPDVAEEATRQPDVAEDDAPNALPVPLLQQLQRDVLALQQDWEYEKGGLRIGGVNVRRGNYRNPYRNPYRDTP